jgi:hypothetical protein
VRAGDHRGEVENAQPLQRTLPYRFILLL